jgi:hypothetical protein
MNDPRTIEVPCTVEIEQTPESFHAHAIPQGVAIRPGDSVLVHGAPSHVAFGARLSIPCRATVTRAGWLSRLWTQATAMLELTELYEVGFAPKEIP